MSTLEQRSVDTADSDGSEPDRIGRGSWHDFIEILDRRADEGRHAGRAAIRRTVLTMQPEGDTGPIALSEPVDRDGERFWAILGRNGVTLALRLRDFHTDAAALDDAAWVLGAADRMVVCSVGDSAGRHSTWVVLDGRVVLVGAQAWRSGRPATHRQLERILRRLAGDAKASRS